MNDTSNHVPTLSNLTDKYQQLMETVVEEVTESFRWLASQLLNVATVLVVVNITVIGYAAANKHAGMFLIGVVVTLILWCAYAAGMLGAVPLLCRLFLLEEEASQAMGKPIITGISLTFLSVLGAKFIDEAQRVNKLNTCIELQTAMRKLSLRMLVRFPTKYGTAVLLLVSLIQIVVVPMLVYVFGWSLF